MISKINSKILLAAIFVFCSAAFSQIEEPAKVRGRATDYTGAPLEKVEVKFFLLEKKSGEYVSAEGKFIKSAFTNRDGEYEATDLPWGEYRVTTLLSGFSSAEIWRFYLGRDAERVLDFGLKIGITHGLPLLEISGTVRSKDKSPVKNATVTLMSAFDETEIERTKTGNDGKYEFRIIHPGQYVIYVSKPGFAVAASSFLINGLRGTAFPETAAHKNIDIELRPWDKLTGK